MSVRGWLEWNRYRWFKRREKVVAWIANHLPRSVVYWATIRLGVHATTGPYGDQLVPELTLADALKRWEFKR